MSRFDAGKDDFRDFGLVVKKTRRATEEAQKRRLGAISSLQGRLDGAKPPGQLGPEQFKSNVEASNVGARFEAIRRKAEQGARAGAQEAEGALQRRLAATGALNSGAGIKLLQQQTEKGQQGIQEALTNVDIAQQQEQQREDENVRGLRLQERSAFDARNFQRELVNNDNEFKNRVFEFDSGSKIAALDLQFQDLEESIFANRINIFKKG